MDLTEALRTTGSCRSFTDEAVDDDVVAAILDDARFAPSGGNRQPWRVAVVKDPTARRTLADLMTDVWQEYLAQGEVPGRAPFAFGRSLEVAKRVAAPNPVLDGIEKVPVVLAVAADLARIALMDADVGHPPMTGGASVYPFCWSILLAARAHGLGGVLTTFLSRAEPKAAAVLGLPQGHALIATIFIGHPVHLNTKLARQAVSSFTTVDRFDGPVLT